MRRVALACLVASAACLAVVPPTVSALPATGSHAAPDAAASGPPADPRAPWPTMRHDLRNTGASPLPAADSGGRPWSFPTGRGIFATPVVAADGTVYAGSADHVLYGLDPRTGRERWRFETGGLIDTAPALLAAEPEVGPSLVVGSGDETLSRVRTNPSVPRSQRVLWQFRPTLPPVEGAQLVSWWEGSPNVGPDGTVYVGNTGGGAYAVAPDGSQRWAFQAGNAVWTVPALDDSGTTYWGSVDLSVFALNPDGSQKWKRTTLGYVTSSPALDRGGTLYVGSFDGNLYALDAASGAVKWLFATRDHIYASPALVEAPDGALQQIVVASTDGNVYAVAPDGSLLWSHDTGAPIRSSPVVGAGPEPGDERIVYVGSANGQLTALDVDSGSWRWAFDTTPARPDLATRKQLNSSPALGPDGIYLGSQDGTIWGIPYEYCLRDAKDPRCVSERTGLPSDGMYLFGVDVGGGLAPLGKPVTISPGGTMIGRIVVRRAGRTVPARLVPAPSLDRLVSVTPDIPVQVSVSGDGRYVIVRPEEMLPPGTEYTVRVNAVVTTGGPEVGNVVLGTGELSAFTGRFSVRTGDDGTTWTPTTGPERVTGVSLSRLAVPLPALLTSVNQIGFDFYDWIGGAVRTDADATVMWFVGAKRDQRGRIVADPATLFAFPVHGTRRGGSFSWQAANVNLWFTFGPVPLRRFTLNGTFNRDAVIRPDAQFLAEAVCADIPGYGATMPLTGMCDEQGVITAAGTFLGREADSPAVRRAPGVTVGEAELTRPDGSDGSVSAPVTVAPDRTYRPKDHVVAVLLLDADSGRPVALDYVGHTDVETDSRGNISRTTVRIPAGTALPQRLEAVVMTDAFPAGTTILDGSGT